jgi:hypothetical protein
MDPDCRRGERTGCLCSPETTGDLSAKPTEGAFADIAKHPLRSLRDPPPLRANARNHGFAPLARGGGEKDQYASRRSALAFGVDIRIPTTMSKSPPALSNRRAHHMSAPVRGDKLRDRFGDKSHINGLKNRNLPIEAAHWNSASETIIQHLQPRSSRQKSGSSAPAQARLDPGFCRGERRKRRVTAPEVPGSSLKRGPNTAMGEPKNPPTERLFPRYADKIAIALVGDDP